MLTSGEEARSVPIYGCGIRAVVYLLELAEDVPVMPQFVSGEEFLCVCFCSSTQKSQALSLLGFEIVSARI